MPPLKPFCSTFTRNNQGNELKSVDGLIHQCWGQEESFYEWVVNYLHKQKIALFVPVLWSQHFLNLLKVKGSALCLKKKKIIWEARK